MGARRVFAVLAILAVSSCASFNDPDDDPALCENGRHPKPNGECPNPAAPMLDRDLIASPVHASIAKAMKRWGLI